MNALIRLKVLFFGATADAVGSRELELAADGATTANSVIDHLSQKYPKLANHKLFIAVNEEYADPDTRLNNGDEIALFTSVSGG